MVQRLDSHLFFFFASFAIESVVEKKWVNIKHFGGNILGINLNIDVAPLLLFKGFCVNFRDQG